MKFVGVDLETSGTDHDKSVPIQFGYADGEGKPRSWYIGGWDWNEWEWSERAAEVHNINKTKLQIAATAPQVDAIVSNFLARRQPEGQSFCMIGWNVAGFDRPFIEKHMPLTFSLFSYRTVDLNAICFALAIPQVRSYDRIKKESKEYALLRIGDSHEEAWHDAGFDALAAIYSYEYLRKMAWSGINFDKQTVFEEAEYFNG